MRLYQIVWLSLLSFISIKAVQSLTGMGSFWGNNYYLTLDEDETSNNPDIKNTYMRNKNSYLFQIGTDNKKYCFLYEPDAIIFSFGGSRRDIFERTLLSLKVGKIFTIVSSETMKGTIQTFIDARNQSDKWSVLLSNKRVSNYNVELRKLDAKIRSQFSSAYARPSTILFDLGDFSAEALRLILKKYSRSCVQYVLFNGKHPMTNLKSLSIMMQHAGYRRVTRVRTQRIATFISAKSPVWNSFPVFSNKPFKTT